MTVHLIGVGSSHVFKRQLAVVDLARVRTHKTSCYEQAHLMSACSPTAAGKPTLSDFRERAISGSALGLRLETAIILPSFFGSVRRDPKLSKLMCDRPMDCDAGNQSGAPITRETFASVNRGTSAITASVSADASAA